MTFGPFVFQPSSSYEISDANMGGASTVRSRRRRREAPPRAARPPAGARRTARRHRRPHVVGIGGGEDAGGADALVGPNAKPSLALGGKPVKTLQPGKYLLIAGDSSKKAGLLIGHGTAHPSTLSGVAAVGTTRAP